MIGARLLVAHAALLLTAINFLHGLSNGETPDQIMASDTRLALQLLASCRLTNMFFSLAERENARDLSGGGLERRLHSLPACLGGCMSSRVDIFCPMAACSFDLNRPLWTRLNRLLNETNSHQTIDLCVSSAMQRAFGTYAGHAIIEGWIKPSGGRL